MDNEDSSPRFWEIPLGTPVKWLVILLGMGVLSYLAFWPALVGPPRGYHWWMETMLYEYRGKYGQWPDSLEDIKEKLVPRYRERFSEAVEREAAELLIEAGQEENTSVATLTWNVLIFQRTEKIELRHVDQAQKNWSTRNRFFPPVNE